MTKNKLKYIAFYLPQFHTFPENDKWWGKGFTEWTNTTKSKPLYKGHYQPHTPLNGNYYDLSKVEYMYKQIGFAQKYGVDGFCFYHYWFNGKKLMEKPVENYLKHKDLDLPFCLSWANENWSRRWDGSENELLISQDYGDRDDWEKHFYYLLPYFKDKRYICENGKPLLIIYKPQLIDVIDELLTFWDGLARKNGLNGICFASEYPQFDKEIADKFDYNIEFEPITTTGYVQEKLIKSILTNPRYSIHVISQKFKNILKIHSYKRYNYKLCIKASVKRVGTTRSIYCVFPGWDNSPRRKNGALIYDKNSPKLFENYLYQQSIKSLDENKKYLFINAWNEWAEGAHLEPDEKYGFAFLEAIRHVKNDLKI